MKLFGFLLLSSFVLTNTSNFSRGRVFQIFSPDCMFDALQEFALTEGSCGAKCYRRTECTGFCFNEKTTTCTIYNNSNTPLLFEYKLFTHVGPGNFNHTRKVCKQHAMEMVVIRSQTEYDYLQSHFKETLVFYGLERDPATNNTFDLERDCRQVSKTFWNTNWPQAYPNTRCVGRLFNSMRWRPVDCEAKLFPICQTVKRNIFTENCPPNPGCYLKLGN